MFVKIARLTRAALMLAVVVAVQNLRLMPMFGSSNPASVFIIGSLVNATLLISCETAGLRYSLVIAAIAPLIAMLQGHVPLLVVVPLIICGNLIFLACYALFKGGGRRALLGVVVGATLKWQFFMLAIPYVFKVFLFGRTVPITVVENFLGTTQIITALMGGLIAYAVTRLLRIIFKTL